MILWMIVYYWVLHRVSLVSFQTEDSLWAGTLWAGFSCVCPQLTGLAGSVLAEH